MNSYSKSMFELRQVVSSNVFLYKVWFYLVRKHRGDPVRLPSINDDFYFDGYPRSGNTFLKGLIEKLYPEKKFASHLHSISGIKIALDLNLPVFVLIRKPKDAVVSYLFRKIIITNSSSTEVLIERLLISYRNYYKFVKEHSNYISILEFESAINNETLLLKAVAEIVGFKKGSDAFLQENLKNHKVLMKKKEKQKDSYASSLPNEERAEFKSEYQKKILNSSIYRSAEDIYKELTEYDLLSKKANENISS